MSKLKYYDGTNWKIVNGQVTGDTLPIGAIVPFGGWDAPTGWLICDGTLLNKTDYPELYNAIGYSFGGEDGGATFGLPDLRGRVPLGLKETDTDFNGMGLTGGEKTHTLTVSEIPSHAHSVTTQDTGTGTWWTLKTFNEERAATAGYGTSSTGGGQAHNNLQPYQTVNYIIKAKQSAGVVANVSNIQSDSTTDTYSCDYINNIYSLSTNTPTIDLSQSTVVSNELTVEKSSKSNLFKFYGRLVINGVSNSNGITATIHTGLSGVSANKTYNGFIRFIQQSSTFSPQAGSFTLKQNGDIEISFATANGITRYDFYFQPCTYIIE